MRSTRRDRHRERARERERERETERADINDHGHPNKHRPDVEHVEHMSACSTGEVCRR